MAAAGSVVGYFILDGISRKGGEAALDKALKPRRLERVKRTLNRHGGWMIALACLLPPPFPVTIFIAGGAALQYPRTRMMIIIAVARLARFAILVLLALTFGRQILRWGQLPAVRGAMVVLIGVAVVGSIWTLWKKLRH